MDLPVDLPVAPMLAKAVTAVPAADSLPGGCAYEPKWDGFRCLVLRDGDEIELASRGAKTLTRYFPEVVELVRAWAPARCVIDAELVVRQGDPGAERLDWDALSQRIHPAASRIERLATETPAELICFDLLALADDSLLDAPLSTRRARLETLFGTRHAGIHLTRTTTDPAEAQRWFTEFEGAGLDGVMAKGLDQPYEPGKRTMLKVKHKRTAEAVVYGYRVHKSGEGVGSLLLGLYTDDGQLIGVGGASAFTARRRLELVDELEPFVRRDESGEKVVGQSDRSRFSGSKDVSFVALRPELVVEVAFDQLEKSRFRHAVQVLRFRPDREASSCTLDQVDRAPDYDLAQVLEG